MKYDKQVFFKHKNMSTLTDMEKEIDLVLPWVDGSDPEWQHLKSQYSSSGGDSRDIRFRDWDNLKFLFRGIEKNAPWIRKIHFVTCGQVPVWMNTDHPKLHLVNHTDYIPAEYLPTFNANTIELNVHRIEGLSEQFIYINDDMFFVDRLEPTDFFRKGKPCSQAGLGVLGGIYHPIFAGILFNDYRLIDRHFDSTQVLKKERRLFVNRKYGLKNNIKTLILSAWCQDFFIGFRYGHGPNAFLKSTLEEVWEKERSYLEEVSSHKFRSIEDVNQYVFEYWQWCKGIIIPYSSWKKQRMITVNKDIQYIVQSIESRSVPMITLNDADLSEEEFQRKKRAIIDAFDKILGEKSQYEL